MKRVRKITAGLLLVIMTVLAAVPAASFADTAPDHIIINQIYGGGGKGDTPFTASFIELYNPTDNEISLDGYKLTYSSDRENSQGKHAGSTWRSDGSAEIKELDLSGNEIPSKSSFLIKCAEETTEVAVVEINNADISWNQVIDNDQSVEIILYKESEKVDGISTRTEGFESIGEGDAPATTDISKQKSLRRTNFVDTDNNSADFKLLTWKDLAEDTKEQFIDDYAPRSKSSGKWTEDLNSGGSTEPAYTPAVTGDVPVEGFYNDSASIKLQLTERYNSGAMNADGGSLEIVDYNPVNGFAYAVSGVKGKLIAVNMNGNKTAGKVTDLTGTEYDIKAMLKESLPNFSYGDMTSVAVSPDGSRIAVAVQAEAYDIKGLAALFSCNRDGSITLISTAEVGVQPDMITFADNDTILTADEGEPRQGTAGTDPEGSVSIVTLNADGALSAKTVTFDSFDTQRNSLTAKGVLIQKNTMPSTDFEPEYIAVTGNTAYVSLQEANAVAVLDIPSGTFKDILPLGFQDYETVKVDLQKNDTIELKNYDNVYGIKMPDGITAYTSGGKTYLLTANEGDSRADWAGLDNESEGKNSPTGNVTLNEKVVWFNTGMWDGLDESKAYVFGGRSFSIYEVTADGMTLVYDSGSGFEEITAQKLPYSFNTSNDKLSMDNRSGKKGPEPESVVTGKVGDRLYAFVALERIGGIMVYDITEPGNAVFANYINSREFDEVIKGDVSPEGLCFIPAEDSMTGTPMLLAACEVSGTLAAYECAFVSSQIPVDGDSGQIAEGGSQTDNQSTAQKADSTVVALQ